MTQPNKQGEVWVFAEQEEGCLGDVPRELLGKGRELADRLRLRKPPELRFIPDDTVRKSFEMFEKIKTSSPAPDSEVSE